MNIDIIRSTNQVNSGNIYYADVEYYTGLSTHELAIQLIFDNKEISRVISVEECAYGSVENWSSDMIAGIFDTHSIVMKEVKEKLLKFISSL